MPKTKLKIIDATIRELKKELKTKKVIFGPKVTLKKVKKDKDNIDKIYIVSDCSEETIKLFQKAKVKNKIIKLDLDREELKELCNKKFNISVISILKRKELKKKEETKEKKDIKNKKTKEKKTQEKEK